MILMMILLAAVANEAPKTQERSAVETAMFAIKDDGFKDVHQNEELKVILAQKPQLDTFETAALGDVAALRRRLDADPSAVSARNHFGWTALHFAAFAGNVENAKLLLDRGADVNARAHTKFRNTPLQAALLTGQYDVTKLLLERGADVLVRQNSGFTPMHSAAFLGRLDLLQLLLDHGAELNSRTDDGRTPISEATRRNQTKAVEFLKAKGATPEPQDAKLNSSPD
jgi:uncharacterized protein